jgi:hypothetical protein
MTDLHIIKQFCKGGKVSELQNLSEESKNFFITASHRCIGGNGDQKYKVIASKIIYLLEVKMDKIIEALAQSLVKSGVFATAERNVKSQYEFGFLTKEARDSFLTKIHQNRLALLSEAKYIAVNSRYRDFGSTKEHDIHTPERWAEAILVITKWYGEIKDIANICSRDLSEKDTEIMEKMCQQQKSTECTSPCKTEEGGWFGKDSCHFVHYKNK